MLDLKEISDEFNKICRDSITQIVKDIRLKQVPGIEYSELAYSQYFNDRIQDTLKKAHIKLIEGDYYNFLYFVGEKFLSLKEYSFVIKDCFNTILKHFETPPDIKSSEYNLYVQTTYYQYRCQYHKLIKADPQFRSLTSQQSITNLLESIYQLTQSILNNEVDVLENNYWHINNIALLITEIFSELLKFNNQNIPMERIKYLIYTIKAIESVVTLYSIDYLEMRVNLYHILYKLYLMNKKYNEARKCAYECARQINHIRKLEEIQPPIPPRTVEILNNMDLLSSYMVLKSEILLDNDVIDEALNTYNDDFEKIQALTYALTPVNGKFTKLENEEEIPSLYSAIKEKLDELLPQYTKVYTDKELDTIEEEPEEVEETKGGKKGAAKKDDKKKKESPKKKDKDTNEESNPSTSRTGDNTTANTPLPTDIQPSLPPTDVNIGDTITTTVNVEKNNNGEIKTILSPEKLEMINNSNKVLPLRTHVAIFKSYYLYNFITEFDKMTEHLLFRCKLIRDNNIDNSECEDIALDRVVMLLINLRKIDIAINGVEKEEENTDPKDKKGKGKSIVKDNKKKPGSAQGKKGGKDAEETEEEEEKPIVPAIPETEEEKKERELYEEIQSQFKDLPFIKGIKEIKTLIKMVKSCLLKPYTSFYIYFPDLLRDMLLYIYNQYTVPLMDYLDGLFPGQVVAEPIQDIIVNSLYIILNYSNIIQLNDPLLCCQVALRLGKYYCENKQDYRMAIQIMRNELYNIEKVRDDLVNMDIYNFNDQDIEYLFYRVGITMDIHQHPHFKELAKPLTNNPIIGAGSAYHYYYQDLACYHIDILCQLYDYEFQEAIVVGKEAFKRKIRVNAEMKKKNKYKKTLDLPPELQEHEEDFIEKESGRTEGILANQCRHNSLYRAILNLITCKYRPNKLDYINSAFESLKEYTERNMKLFAVSCSNCNNMIPTKVPPPPLILTRNHSSITIKPDYYKPLSETTHLTYYKAFCKPFGTGTDVSLTNREFNGCNRPVYPGEFVTITGLLPNESYLFAFAAYDQNDELIGGKIGQTSECITTLNPLPVMMIYGYLQLIIEDNKIEDCTVAKEIIKYFVDHHPIKPVHEEISFFTQKLIEDRVRLSHPIVLRCLSHALVYNMKQNTKEEIPSNTPVYHQILNRMEYIQQGILGINVAIILQDKDLILSSCNTVYNSLITLLKFKGIEYHLLYPYTVLIKAIELIPPEQRDEAIRKIYCSICYQLFKIGRKVEKETVKKLLENSVQLMDKLTIVKTTIEEEKSLKLLYTLEGYLQLQPPQPVKGNGKKDDKKQQKAKSTKKGTTPEEDENEEDDENVEYPDITTDFYSQLLAYDYQTVLNYLQENIKHPNFLQYISLLCSYYYSKRDYAACVSILDSFQMPKLLPFVQETINNSDLNYLFPPNSNLNSAKSNFSDGGIIGDATNIPIPEMNDTNPKIPGKPTTPLNLETSTTIAVRNEINSARPTARRSSILKEEKRLGGGSMKKVKFDLGDSTNEEQINIPRGTPEELNQLKWLSYIEYLKGLLNNRYLYGDGHYKVETSEALYTNSLLLNIQPPEKPIEQPTPVVVEEPSPEEATNGRKSKTGKRPTSANKKKGKKGEDEEPPKPQEDPFYISIFSYSLSIWYAQHSENWTMMINSCKLLINCLKLSWKGPEMMWDKFIDEQYKDHALPIKRMAESLVSAMFMENMMDSLSDFQHYNQLNSSQQTKKVDENGNLIRNHGEEYDEPDNKDEKPIRVYDLDREWIDTIMVIIFGLLYGNKEWRYLVSLGERYNKERGEKNEKILKYMKYAQTQLLSDMNKEFKDLENELNTRKDKYQEIQKGKKTFRQRKLVQVEEERTDEEKQLDHEITIYERQYADMKMDLDIQEQVDRDIQETLDIINRDKLDYISLTEECKERYYLYQQQQQAQLQQPEEVNNLTVQTISIKQLLTLYNKTIYILRMRQQNDLLCQLLDNIGDMFLRVGNIEKANKYYVDAIDGMFGTFDIINNYEEYMNNNNIIITLGYKNIVYACNVVYKLYKYTSNDNNNNKLNYTIFISCLIKELFSISYPHPQRYCDYNNYIIDEVWNNNNLFNDISVLSPSLVLEMLYYTAVYLYEYNYYLSAFPILSYGIFISTRLCRNPIYATMFRILLCKAQCKLSYYHNAVMTYYYIITCSECPILSPSENDENEENNAKGKTGTNAAAAKSKAKGGKATPVQAQATDENLPPEFKVYEPIEQNKAIIDYLLDGVILAANIKKLYGETLTHQVTLLRFEILLDIAANCEGEYRTKILNSMFPELQSYITVFNTVEEKPEDEDEAENNKNQTTKGSRPGTTKSAKKPANPKDNKAKLAAQLMSGDPSTLPEQLKIILECNLYNLLYRYYTIQYQYKEGNTFCNRILERIDNYTKLPVLPIPLTFEYQPNLAEYGGFSSIYIKTKLNQSKCLLYMNQYKLSNQILEELDKYCDNKNEIYYRRYLYYIQYKLYVNQGDIENANTAINKATKIIDENSYDDIFTYEIILSKICNNINVNRINNKDQQIEVYNKELEALRNVIAFMLSYLQDNGIIYPPDDNPEEAKREKLRYNVYNNTIKYYEIAEALYVLYTIEKPKLLTEDEYHMCTNYIDEALKFMKYSTPEPHSVKSLLLYEKSYFEKYDILIRIIGNSMKYDESDVKCIIEDFETCVKYSINEDIGLYDISNNCFKQLFLLYFNIYPSEFNKLYYYLMMIKMCLSRKHEFWFNIQSYFNDGLKADILPLEIHNDYQYTLENNSELNTATFYNYYQLLLKEYEYSGVIDIRLNLLIYEAYQYIIKNMPNFNTNLKVNPMEESSLTPLDTSIVTYITNPDAVEEQDTETEICYIYLSGKGCFSFPINTDTMNSIKQLVKKTLEEAKKNLPPEPTPVPNAKGKKTPKPAANRKSKIGGKNSKGATPVPEETLEGSLTEEQHNEFLKEFVCMILPDKMNENEEGEIVCSVEPFKYDVNTSLSLINRIGKLFVSDFNEIQDDDEIHPLIEWFFSLLN